MCSKPIICSNIALKGKTCSRLLKPQKVAPNAKSCSKVAEHNRDRPNDDGGVAQDGDHTPNNRLTETCNLGLLCTSLILDIHVMINWHLSNQRIRWPVSRDHIAGWTLQLIEVKSFFEVDRWPSAGFSIGSRAHVWLTCWKQGRIVRKLVNANPGLNFNQIITFTSFQMFLLLCFVYMVIIETENRRPNNIRIAKSKFYFFLG